MYKNVKLTFVFKTTFFCTVHTFISMDIWYTVIQNIAIFDRSAIGFKITIYYNHYLLKTSLHRWNRYIYTQLYNTVIYTLFDNIVWE